MPTLCPIRKAENNNAYYLKKKQEKLDKEKADKKATQEATTQLQLQHKQHRQSIRAMVKKTNLKKLENRLIRQKHEAIHGPNCEGGCPSKAQFGERGFDIRNRIILCNRQGNCQSMTLNAMSHCLRIQA